MSTPRLTTERLVMRAWEEADLEPFATLNADPSVMEHFPRTLTPEESAAFVAEVRRRFAASGWGLWAVEVRPGHRVQSGQRFIGFVGLWPADFLAPGTVEIGWRLSSDSWGRGYATEAAAEALRFAFEDLGLAEVVSFTSVGNTRSRRVMERIGLVRRPERDFDHPNVDPGTDPGLVRHVLYALSAPEWASATSSATGHPPDDSDSG